MHNRSKQSRKVSNKQHNTKPTKTKTKKAKKAANHTITPSTRNTHQKASSPSNKSNLTTLHTKSFNPIQQHSFQPFLSVTTVPLFSSNLNHFHIRPSSRQFASLSSSTYKHQLKQLSNDIQSLTHLAQLRKQPRRLFSTTLPDDTTQPDPSQPTPQDTQPTTPSDVSPTTEETQPTDSTTPTPSSQKRPVDPEDPVYASIPRPRNSTDQNQYKISTPWKKPVDEYQNLTPEQRQEIKERFTLENHHRINSALNRLRSTKGTMAYGAAQGSDMMDGSLPQRNGSMSGNVLDAFDRAEEYKRKRDAKKQQQELIHKQQQILQEQKKEFEFDPKSALETDFGEFAKNTDHLFKRKTSPEELENQRAEQIMGKNWMARWF